MEGHDERVAVVGTGTIAQGLVAAATLGGMHVTLLGRSDESLAHALSRVRAIVAKAERPARLAPVPTTRVADLEACTFVVEAVAEDLDVKRDVLRTVERHVPPQAVIASTTSSLRLDDLGAALERPERLAALHVFNPVHRMELVEIAFAAAAADVRIRTRALAAALGKVPVEVAPDPGFVVNALLFPFLFSAVDLCDRTGASAEDVDRCMVLGAGHPLGPLALLDLVGLDVAVAIGDALDLDVPPAVRALATAGHLGRKTGRGFHAYG